MALKYLGPEFDLHVGGIDLRFPHHENSRALATAATGKRFASLWVHAAHLLVDGRKMSKSAGNEYTLDDLASGPPGRGGGFFALDFRYYCLTLHYATPMNFTWEGQAAAAKSLARLRNAFRKAAERATKGEGDAAVLRDRFREAISDNLNMPRAVAVAHEAARSAAGGDVARSLAREWDAVLAVGLLPRGAGEEQRPEEVPAAVAEMAREREERRRARDFAAADALRERIRAAGYDVVDGAEGPASLRKLQGSTGG
jgi:cysteinyl-tRNA synthetase